MYEQLKTEVRVKSMSAIQAFYSTIDKFYDKAVTDKLYSNDSANVVFRSVKELNFEVFGCSFEGLSVSLSRG